MWEVCHWGGAVALTAAGAAWRVLLWRWRSQGLQVCRCGCRILDGVAAGSRTVSKACLGHGADEFLEEAAFPFKMTWAPCLSPAVQGVPAVVLVSPCPREPGLPASAVPAGFNCPSLTHSHTTHIHTLSFHPLTHFLYLTSILPAAIFLIS
uniref:Uncharacterized protein n=1 Tax=Myotis myotis TaxID=51298 RepID=A0A7J7QTN8_MYOMY|nr:hypothetical protein mMyoMyo1_011574 [Myotis myotis]